MVEDREAWRAAVRGVTQSRTQLNNNKYKPVQLTSSTSSVCKATRKGRDKTLHPIISTKHGASSWKQIPGSSSKLFHSILRGCSPGNSGMSPGLKVNQVGNLPAAFRALAEESDPRILGPGVNQAGAWYNFPSRGQCWLKVSPCIPFWPSSFHLTLF